MDQIRDDNEPLVEVIESAMHANSFDLGAFLCFMGVRLLEMKRVLKETGSIYLHCDPTASHYLKASMDAVFSGAECSPAGAGMNRYGSCVWVILYDVPRRRGDEPWIWPDNRLAI